VKFGLLGLLEVTDEGRVVAIPSARQRALLACLLLRAGALVTVDELAEAIWGEDLPAHPRRAVQTYVARLRKLLGDGLLHSRSEGYVLAAAAGDVDVGRFELLLAQARDAAAAGRYEEALACLRESLAIRRELDEAQAPLAERLGAAFRRPEA
jgi:DNA-binding SARP family transcriptional activator